MCIFSNIETFLKICQRHVTDIINSLHHFPRFCLVVHGTLNIFIQFHWNVA
jgi:hypothetical protein